ncbi:MAG: Brp/Blh family beta-carotene 15,15'-dioxygenase [Sphingomonas bacterium]|nr:Brp/Blh family beta-carotene 15,15'-dioxygenase [Sphingomonas bacterium]
MVRLLESSNANAMGRHGDVPPASILEHQGRYPSIALFLTLTAALVPPELLASPTMIAATCAALLIGGLPHGALDLAVLRRDAQHRIALVVSLYLGLAAIMFAIWQVAPAIALGLFLAMAMVHFAEDWAAAEHPFFALGIAVALLSAPALFHRQAVGDLFTLLTAEQAAAGLADALLLVAPAAAACALLAILLLWQGGHRVTAVNAACALAAMILLPPITGFAIYFCLIHSPSHFRAGLKRLAPATGITRPTIGATLGGLTIAVATLQFLPITDPSGRLFAASFMTLSILTLPHMAVPFLLRRLCLSAQAVPQRI